MLKNQLKKLHIYKEHEDYYQVAQILLWKAYQQFDATKGAFPGYAQHLVRCGLIDHLRKERIYEDRHEMIEWDSKTEGLLGFFIQEENHPLLDEIEERYKHLSKREKIWLIETFINDRKLSEIAHLYQVSKHTVSSWRKACLKKLRGPRLSND